MGHSSKAGENIFWAMNRNKPGIIKRILNALERFIARIRGKDAYLAVEQRQAAERLRDMLTGELKRAYGTDVKGEAAVESGEGKRHSLAGANSRTADLNSLGGAYQMYQNGVSMDTIRKRTGWWLGKDGKWRYEISDKEMRFNPDGYVNNPTTVGDYVKHDRLFAAYPWIADIPVHIVDVVTGGSPATNGKFSPDGKFIELKKGLTSEKAKYVLSHELQHAIQQAEGFVRGTSPKTGMFYAVNLAYDLVKNNPEFVAESKPQDKMNYLIGYLEAKGGASLGDYAKYYYFQNYGETEARNVSQRLDMTEEERRALPIENNGEVFSYDEVFEKIVDNLKAIGYNKKQIDTILKEGVSYDIEQTDVQTSADEVVKRRRNDREETGRLSDADENGRRPGEIYRTGKIPTAGVSESAEILDSERRNGGLRRGNRGTDSQNGAIGAGSEAGKRLNEVSKPEKRFSLSSADTDIYSRIFDMQREETELTNRIGEIEKSDAFKNAIDDLSKAINNDNIAEGMKAYQAWSKESGYADLVDRRDALRADLKEIRTKANNDAVSKAINEERTAIEKSGLSEADYFRKQAVKEFGYTPYFYDAGYIMPNGKMLNFSGEKGRHYGSRGQDHRAIGTIYADTNGTDALVRFMNDGNIRIMAETPGLDISASTEPSKEQYTTIRRFANEFSDGGYFAVDLSDENGKTVGTLEYEGNINPTRIVNDIKHFYETGEVREQSGLDRFRYSLARANDEYMKAVESGNVEEQQRLVDEAAENAGYNTVLYHGTQSFGFTQIDVSKYSDDGMSFFATSNPEMAQTYSAKSGTREISRKSGIENLSLPQVVDRLNAVAAADTSDYDRYTYRIMNRSDTEALKKSIQSGIKELRAETERLISEYADRLAKDFNGEDELKHSRLRSLLNALESDSASKLSANLYTVLNHNEIFDDAAKVKFGNLEADIRLLKKLAALKTDEDVVVREDTDRYDIVVEDQEKARKRLEKLDNSGNYVLRGRTEGFLEIDGNGHNWNDIFTTLEPKGGNILKAEYDFGSESLKLSDRDGEFAVIPAKSVADAVSPMARAFARRYGTTFATTVLAQTKDQLKNSATAEVKIKSTGKTNTRDIANFAREEGYPGVKITDIYDNGGRGSEAGRGDVYIFFNPEQDVKSADPITYDDSGNVIPLTERFDSGNRDIRYSLVKSAQSELKALQKENEKLRQDVDDLKQELQLTHGRKLSRDALISSIQKILIDGYGVKLSAKELYPHVTNLYDMFYNNTVDGKRLKKDERVDTMRIIEEMDKIVDAVIENAVGVDDTYVEMKKLLPELRNTKLVVPVDARADAAQSAGFENWAEFRKANFGRVGFANEGLPVDTYYMELSERYPELFPDGITHPGEQAAHIADVVNTIRESGINEYQLYDIEDERIRTSIKNDVMDIIGNAEKLQTFADRAAQKVEDTKLAEAMHYGADIAKLKRLNAEKVADIKAENRKRLSDMRRKYKDRVESVRERYAEARANRSEKQKQTVLRNKVLRKYTEASSMLDRPTTENHFTEAMRKPLMEFLAAVDITTGKSVAKQGIYDRILRVIEAANNMAAEGGKNGLDIAETDLNVQEKQLIVDSGLLERMSAWVEANKGKKLTELSSAQLFDQIVSNEPPVGYVHLDFLQQPYFAADTVQISYEQHTEKNLRLDSRASVILAVIRLADSAGTSFSNTILSQA